MRENQLTKNKEAKAALVARHLHEIPTPCGCIPTLVACDCPIDSCSCELDLEFCDCYWEPEPWDEFRMRLWKFFWKLDPGSYSEPSLPTTPIITLGRDARLIAYESRYVSGFALRNSEIDLNPETRKNGERITRAANGAVVHQGTQAEVETNYRVRHRPTQENGSRQMARIRSEPSGETLHDIICASEV